MDRAPQHCRREPSMPQITAARLARPCLERDVTEAEGNERSSVVKQRAGAETCQVAVDARTTTRRRPPKSP